MPHPQPPPQPRCSAGDPGPQVVKTKVDGRVRYSAGRRWFQVGLSVLRKLAGKDACVPGKRGYIICPRWGLEIGGGSKIFRVRICFLAYDNKS